MTKAARTRIDEPTVAVLDWKKPQLAKGMSRHKFRVQDPVRTRSWPISAQVLVHINNFRVSSSYEVKTSSTVSSSMPTRIAAFFEIQNSRTAIH